MKNYAYTILLSGLAGALNSFLCFSGMTVCHDTFAFQSHIIFAGWIHSMMLTLIPLHFGKYFCQNWPNRIVGVVLIGFFSGWVSGVILQLSIGDTFTVRMLTWPFEAGGRWYWVPYQCFGLVSAFLFLGMTQPNTGHLGFYLFIGGTSGILGSFAFWYPRWHLSLIHGIFWGLLVGLGLWLDERASYPKAKPADAVLL